MKNFKRTLALVLAVIMVAGMFASVSAAEAKWYAGAVRYIEGVGIATIGSTAGEKITRNEFVLWVAKLESGSLNDAYWSSAIETPFTDITEEHNQTAIWYSARRGLIVGNGDGTFAPDKNLTFAEAAAVIVRLMRYTSKVEGGAEDWAWANMEVANEYCNAFTNEFLANVGGSVYDYDYELTKGEVAYLLATIMNASVIEGQVGTNFLGQPTYKSLTIDGHNLGERFIGMEGAYGVSGNTYMINAIEFATNGAVKEGTDVVLTPVSAASTTDIELDDEEFTSLVRVALGLTAEPAEDEADVRIVDTVKIGNLVDVVLDKDGDVVSLNVHTGSVVVDTHVVMDSMLGVDYNGKGIANWTADSIVSGASNSNEYRDAIINSKWTADLLYTWTLAKDGESATLTFKGEEYDFSNDATKDNDLVVYVENNNELVEFAGTVEQLIALMPDVATGEATVIFNDADLDGEYDTLVITNDYRSNFYLEFINNKTVNDLYYAEGYSINATKASGKLQLLVLAQGRFGHYSINDVDGDKSVENNYTANDDYKYGRNYMNPYAVIDLATISSGVIEESTLKTFNNDKYFVVKVKNAAGAYATVYIPFDPSTVEEPTFEYTINGVTKELDKDLYTWDPATELSFVEYAKKEVIGLAEDAKDYAKYAARLVGQYISYIVDAENVAIYCKSGSDASASGYVLDIAATDVANMYNATILTVDANGNAKDVAIYSVNATASVMMNKGANYETIADLFNKAAVVDGNVYNNDGLTHPVYDDKGVATTHQASIALRGDMDKYFIKSLVNVDVHSNGTFTYIELDETETGIRFDRNDGVWGYNLNDTAIVDTADKDAWEVKELINGTWATDADGDETAYVAVDPANKPTISVSYSGEFYSNPIYRLDTKNNKWTLAVTTQTVTVEYIFNVDTMTITTDNVLSIETSAPALYSALVGVNEATNVGVDKNGKEYLKSLESWVNLTVNEKGEVTAVAAYDATNGFDRGTEDKTVYTVAGKVVVNSDKSIAIDYDFRGIDFTYDVVTDKVTMKDLNEDDTNEAYYTFGDAKVDKADVLVALAAVEVDVAATGSGSFNKTNNPEVFVKKATNVNYTVDTESVKANATNCISNVTFTAMEAGKQGYIPGSYYFSIDNANKVYYNNLKDHAEQNKIIGYTAEDVEAYLAANTDLEESNIGSKDRKYRVTANTEVVLMTPSASGWTIKVMTPAEAAKLDLIVTAVSFVDALAADIATGEAKANFDAFNYKLDTLVLVGQEALVATEPEVEVDDGLEVGAGEYLVYVPEDVETILVAPEGSKTVKVATTKSVYAIPSGTEIGAIFYEYDVYGGTESVKIKTEIAKGWYLVDENGEIISTFDMAKKTTDKKNGAFMNKAYVTVEGGKVVAKSYVENKTTNAVFATYDLETATVLYYDIDGTLKVAADKDAKFASDAVFQLTIKSAKDAYTAAQKAYDTAVANDYSDAKQAELAAALEAAKVAYEEALVANIDKFFNGDIWESFKATVATETSIQGAGQYTVDVYEVDGKEFVILNTWTPGEVPAIGSALK